MVCGGWWFRHVSGIHGVHAVRVEGGGWHLRRELYSLAPVSRHRTLAAAMRAGDRIARRRK